jgi:hypothetical protein
VMPRRLLGEGIRCISPVFLQFRSLYALGLREARESR